MPPPHLGGTHQLRSIVLLASALALAPGCLPSECGANSNCASPVIYGASGDFYGGLASMLVGTTQRIFADGASLVSSDPSVVRISGGPLEFLAEALAKGDVELTLFAADGAVVPLRSKPTIHVGTKATLELVLPLASPREPAVLHGVSFDFSVALEDESGFRYADENLAIATQGGSLARIDWWRGAITTDASAANVTVALTSVALPTTTHVLPVMEEAAIDTLALSNDAALIAGRVSRNGALGYCPYSIATDHEIVNDREITITATGPLTLDRIGDTSIFASSRVCYWLRGRTAGDASITLTRGAVQRVYTFRLE